MTKWKTLSRAQDTQKNEITREKRRRDHAIACHASRLTNPCLVPMIVIHHQQKLTLSVRSALASSLGGQVVWHPLD
jgi:hypothetical protein